MAEITREDYEAAVRIHDKLLSILEDRSTGWLKRDYLPNYFIEGGEELCDAPNLKRLAKATAGAGAAMVWLDEYICGSHH